MPIRPDEIDIEIIYALPEQAWTTCMRLPAGATVGQALTQANVLEQFPLQAIDADNLAVYGKTAHLDTVLRNHDRIEILRPLLMDPMQARRLRAKK